MLSDVPTSPPNHGDAGLPASDPPHSDPKTSVIAKIGMFAADKWPATLALWLLLVGGGAYAFLGGLAREGFPPVNVPIVLVSGVYFVDDVETVDADISIPLSEAYADVDGVVSVFSNATANSVFTVVEFDSDISSPEGASRLQTATDSLALPTQANVDVSALDATKFVETYDILVSVSGPDGADAAALEAEAEKIRAFLAETSGVTSAETRNLITAAEGTDGAIQERQTRFARTYFAGNSEFTPAIQVGLVRDANDESLDILGFSDLINERLESAPALADGFRVDITGDFAVDIRNQVNSLIGNLVTGLLAVFAVSLLLIGWRASVVTALFMMTVVAVALLALWAFGYSLNTITLFGLILTLGLLVDDAIVIGESIDATKSEGGTRERILGVSLTRVALASLAGTLTTVLVFGPLAFIGGILGEFIRAIPVTVVITLIVSYIASVVFIPALGKFLLLSGGPSKNPFIMIENRIASAMGRLASFPARKGVLGIAVGVLLALIPIFAVGGAGQIASSLGFNIFPASKDANILFIGAEYPPGTTVEDANKVAAEVDDITVDVLGDNLVRAQYVRGNGRISEAFLDLTPFGDRDGDNTAPLLKERLQEQLSGIDGARVTVTVLDAGPPVVALPFAVQIDVPDDNPEAAQALADELVAALPGQQLDKTGDPASITAVTESSAGQILRLEGQRLVEVRAAFSSDDLTNNLNAAQTLIEEDLVPPSRLAELGLPEDALTFDFGQESDNQDDFAALGTTGIIALGLMLLLLVFQFRSILQPILVFLAIPFSFFGLTGALALTDNGISFFSAVGFIALIGVVVNNTILLVDSANQARRSGMSLSESIEQAVSRRFRPLIATAITTVAGLLPLALSDPFWEGLSFTLMGGLLSSTVLVLVSFPIYYLFFTWGLEALGVGRRWLAVLGVLVLAALLAALLGGNENRALAILGILGTVLAVVSFLILLDIGLSKLKGRSVALRSPSAQRG